MRILPGRGSALSPPEKKVGGVSPDPAVAWAGTILNEKVEAEPLAGDGGGRRYFRLRGRELVVLSGPDPAENLAWLRIGRHLWFQGLPLPRIYDYDLDRGFFLLEDLGDERLADPPDKTDHYPEAARLLARFHLKGAEGFNPAWGHQTKAYDARMATEQEINYYLNSLIAGYLGLGRPSGLGEEARRLGRLAAPGPAERVLMHRDYQGRNLMLKAGRIHIIDWQGARPGPAAYDLASLIEETPYVPLSEERKAETVAAYIRARGTGAWRKTFKRELAILSAVRMMQALGAYGKFVLAGKSKFESYISPLLRRLAEQMGHPALAGFPRLRRVTEEALIQTASEGPCSAAVTARPKRPGRGQT